MQTLRSLSHHVFWVTLFVVTALSSTTLEAQFLRPNGGEGLAPDRPSRVTPAQPVLEVPSTRNTSRNATQSADPNYIFQPKDYIQVSVFEEPDMQTVTRISKEGRITLPLIGAVRVGGKQLGNVEKEIRAALMDGYIRDPKVSITVIEFATQRFTVLGQVNRPGSFEIPQQERIDILQAVGMAGGYTRIAAPNRVMVKRQVKGKEVTYRVDAKKMARDSSVKRFIVRPGDVITVSESIF